MFISKQEIEKMKERYPDDNSIAFNYMQAKEDFFRLSEAYISLMDGFCGSNQNNDSRQDKKRKYLVLISSSYVRDAQILPENHYEDEEDNNGNAADNEQAWTDFVSEMLIGIFEAGCSEEAIAKAADSEDIHTYKLMAYQIAG